MFITAKELVEQNDELLFMAAANRKRLDSDRIHAMGWRGTTPLADGLRQTIEWYQAHHR